MCEVEGTQLRVNLMSEASFMLMNGTLVSRCNILSEMKQEIKNLTHYH